MTDRDAILMVLEDFGPLSDYGIYHAAKAVGIKMTPSSARSRRAELVREGYIRKHGEEESPTGHMAAVWAAA